MSGPDSPMVITAEDTTPPESTPGKNVDVEFGLAFRFAEDAKKMAMSAEKMAADSLTITSSTADRIKELSALMTGAQSMNAVTRDEVNAKLEAVEARMDARVASIESKLDGNLARMAAHDELWASKFLAVEKMQEEAKTAQKDTQSQLGSLKTTIIVTAVSAVLAIVLGVAAFNATVLSNMVASFESGKNTAVAITLATDQMKETQGQLKSLQEQMAKQPPLQSQSATQPDKKPPQR